MFPHYIFSFKYWNICSCSPLPRTISLSSYNLGSQHPCSPERANSAQGHQERLLSKPSDAGRSWVQILLKCGFQLLRSCLTFCSCLVLSLISAYVSGFIRRLSWWLAEEVCLMNWAQVLTNMLPFTKGLLPWTSWTFWPCGAFLLDLLSTLPRQCCWLFPQW